MKGSVNMNGVSEGGFVLPDNEYEVEIAEKSDKQSKNGDPMINIKLIVKRGEFKSNWVWDNILIPLPDSSAAKILGRTKHFLHCIGEPYEGDVVNWDSDKWVGKTCFIITGQEKPNDYHKNTKNIVRDYILQEETTTIPEEETPF